MRELMREGAMDGERRRKRELRKRRGGRRNGDLSEIYVVYYTYICINHINHKFIMK